MVIRWLRSWQLMAVIAVIGVGVAVAAAAAEAAARVDVPTAADGFGETAELASAGEDAGDGKGDTAPPEPDVAELWLNQWLDKEGSPAFQDGPVGPGPREAGPDARVEAPGVAAEDVASATGAPGHGADDTPTANAPADDAPTTDSGAAADADAAARGMRPAAVRIPAIAVHAPTIPLGLMANGEIEVPEDPDLTGWWADGPAPGTPGPTVLLGHVNDWSGPAVFNNLHTLSRGDEVLVDRADGTTVVYAVTAASLHDKDAFPTDAVYRARSDTSLLRLVTCGGSLDRQSGSYDSNYVVFAEQIRVEAPPQQTVPL